MYVIFKLYSELPDTALVPNIRGSISFSDVEFIFEKECYPAELYLRLIDAKIIGGNIKSNGWCIFSDKDDNFCVIDLDLGFVTEGRAKAIVREYKLNKIL